jgi:hypothetical protein
MEYYLKKIGILEMLYGSGITATTETSTLWLKDKLQNNDLLFYPIRNIEIGKFYFMFYAMKEKNVLENIAALFIIGEQTFNKVGIVYYGVNFNYLPVILRHKFFNELFKGLDKKFYEDEFKNNVLKEKPIQVQFSTVYNILKGIGFEWAIREITPKAIEECYLVSFQDINKFCNINLTQLTGMTDEALAIIAQKKYEKQDKRERDLINRIKSKTASKQIESIFNKY